MFYEVKFDISEKLLGIFGNGFKLHDLNIFGKYFS